MSSLSSVEAAALSLPGSDFFISKSLTCRVTKEMLVNRIEVMFARLHRSRSVHTKEDISWSSALVAHIELDDIVMKFMKFK